jgi:hypothetical protein
MPIIELFKTLGLGIFFGLQAALYGYLKSEDLPVSWQAIFTRAFWDKFDPIKALKTTLLGGVIGFFTTLQMGGFITAENFIFFNFANAIMVMGVDQFIKLIVRRTPIVKAWNKLKSLLGMMPLQ